MNIQDVLLMIIAGAGSFAAVLSIYRSGLPAYLVMLALFPWFLPFELAIFTASVVHFLDYLIKFSVIRYRARFREVVLFGGMVMIGSWIGSNLFLDFKSYSDILLFGVRIGVFPIVYLGFLAVSILLELVNDRGLVLRFRLPDAVAGVVLGVFSGFSGVFESAKKHLYKPAGLNFVQLSAVTIVSSLFSDMARLPVYIGLLFRLEPHPLTKYLSFVAGLGALLAVVMGVRYLKEVRDEMFRQANLWIFLASALGLIIRNFV